MKKDIFLLWPSSLKVIWRESVEVDSLLGDSETVENYPIIGFKTFFGIFLKIIYVLRKIVITLFLFVILMGIVLAYLEGLSIGNGIYFAFVTALTLGYGDIVPHTAISKFICGIILPLTGMLLTGIMVAAAIHAIERGVKGKIGK